MTTSSRVEQTRTAFGPTYLLDGNVLVALIAVSHVHHPQAARWFAGGDWPFATCPITQGTLLRLLSMTGEIAPLAALNVLEKITANSRHQFWADDLPYGEVSFKGIVGHRQITDAYLAALARRNGGKLASFDRGLVALHKDIAVDVGAS